MLKKFVEDSFPRVEAHAGAGEECEESFPWRGKSDRNSMWWTDHNLHLPSPCATGEGWGRGFGSEEEPRKKGEVGEGAIKIWFYFSLSYSNLIGN